MMGVWFYSIGASILGLLGIAALLWALCADRARGRKRCPRCWYSMAGAPALRCAECGHEAANARQLYRTRRRWKAAAGSLLIFAVAASLAIQPKVQRDGFGSVVPITGLVLLLQIDDYLWVINGIDYHIASSWTEEREEENAMWRWQWRWLGRTALARVRDQSQLSNELPYQSYYEWLSQSRQYGGDPRLSAEITRAFEAALARADAPGRHSAVLYSVDLTDIEGSLARVSPFLDDDNVAFRSAAILALWRIAEADPDQIEPVLNATTHEDPTVRRLAVIAVGAVGDKHGDVPGACEAILATSDDPDCRVRHLRVHALARMQPDEQAWNTIAAAMRSADICARRGGYLAAWHRAPRPASIVADIIDALDDDDQEIRRRAVLTCAKLQDDELESIFSRVAELENLTGHEDVAVRDAVRSLLDRIDMAR